MRIQADGGVPVSPDASLLRPAGAAPSGSEGQGLGGAHAKAILFGEHAVVYGAPAVAFVNVAGARLITGALMTSA